MDVYDKGILLATVPAAIWLGWFWRPLRTLMLVVTALSLLAIVSYDGDLRRGDTVFWLKYFLSSQSAILWMSMLFFMSTAFYWIGMFARGPAAALEGLGSKLAWVAVTLALVGTMVRWYEGYQIGPTSATSRSATCTRCSCCSRGSRPVLPVLRGAVQDPRLGAFVMLVVSAAVGFLLWYTLVRDAQEIQPG
jgi:hypothetical protein